MAKPGDTIKTRLAGWRGRTRARLSELDWPELDWPDFDRPDIDLKRYFPLKNADGTRHLKRPRIRLGHVITAPVIYVLIVPFTLLDLFVSLYHAICFPVYGIARVRRADYIRIDRHKLAYLNPVQKLNCVYCSYINGLIAYVAEIAARTESYWCPIKHATRLAGQHDHYQYFMEYGQDRSVQEEWEKSRARLRPETPSSEDTSAAPNDPTKT